MSDSANERIEINYFESEKHRLVWLVQYITEICLDLKPTRNISEAKDVFLVASSFIDTGIDHARGIAALLDYKIPEATPPIHRSLYELSLNLKFLLGSENPNEYAIRFLINSTLEAQEFIKRNESYFQERSISKMQAHISYYKSNYPDIFDMVQKQRQKRNFNWSGKSISAIEREIKGKDVQLYKLLSWEAHVTLAPLRDVKVTLEKQRAVLSFGGFHKNPLINPDIVALSTGRILFSMWGEYSENFGLPQIEMPSEKN